jgi:uncharacterized membrane protein YhaH (DUF805 family)
MNISAFVSLLVLVPVCLGLDTKQQLQIMMIALNTIISGKGKNIYGQNY